MPDTHAHGHAHSHSLHSSPAPVEFVLWLIWCVLRPVVAGADVNPRARVTLFSCAVALIAINLVWLAT